MNYGIYGGAFDPFHNGHMSMIDGALKSHLIDRILIVPTGVPVLKNKRDLTLSGYRYYMARKAVEGIRLCDVSPIEVVSEQTSYTVDTLRTLTVDRSFDKKDRLFLICGSDVLFEFEKWYKPDEIMKMATLMIAERPGFDERKAAEKALDIEKKFSGKVKFFSIDPVDVSSRNIRANRDFSQIPDPVSEFIMSNDLYPSDRPLAALSDQAFDEVCEIGRILFSELSEKRFLHSMNTAVLAIRYALRFGEDPDTAAIAGLLHDCAKELPVQQQITLAEDMCKTEPPIVEMVHAPAGARYAQTRYHITDEKIIDAICYHTTGRGGMSGMEKIIYLADKLEPARKFDDLKEIRKQVESDLDAAMIECLRSVRTALKQKGMYFHEDSSKALAELEQQKSAQKTKEERMDSKTISEKISEILTDKKAINVEIIPIAQKTIIADYFVVATGSSTTHVKSLAEEISYVMKNDFQITTDRVEGMSTARWVLIDYKDVIVHIFHPEERENYSLEKLWETRPADPTII